jgi:hypothetical protein
VASGLGFDVDRYLEDRPLKAKGVFHVAETSRPSSSNHHMNM